MSNIAVTKTPRSPIVAAVETALRLLDSVPYTFLALPLRVGAAAVFWLSAQSHLANWDTTLELFSDDYKVPLLPPDLAAYMAVAIEATTPFLLVAGFLTRGAALVLLGMTTVIEVFVYPQAWPTHIQWAAMLLMLLCRGPGKMSVDYLIYLAWRRMVDGDAKAPAA
jgi:putative oxidoreductase